MYFEFLGSLCPRERNSITVWHRIHTSSDRTPIKHNHHLVNPS